MTSFGKTQSKTQDRYLVPGLKRGLGVLRAFTPQRHHLTLAQLAEALGMTRSAVFRSVYTLTDLGYLAYDERSQSYALGPEVLRLSYGYVATRELVEVAQDMIERLRSDTGWSAHLGVLDGTSVLYVLRLPSKQGEASIVHVGSRLPARSTTMGRVLLSGLPEERLIRLYQSDTETTGAATRFAPVLKQWRQDREQGVIRHVGKFEAGIVSIAAPLRDATGEYVAAISLSTHVHPAAIADLDERIEAMIRAAADAISARLGWRRPGEVKAGKPAQGG